MQSCRPFHLRAAFHASVLMSIIGVLTGARVCAQDISIPDRFFFGLPQPDGSMQLSWECPSSLDSKSMAEESGWWNACAKIAALIDVDTAFKAAWHDACEDPALSGTGITYAEWSRSTQEHKREVREKINEVVEAVVQRHKLPALLVASHVDSALIAVWRARQEKEVAKALGVDEPTDAALIRYCPGAPGNVSINPQHREFGAFEQLMRQPGAAKRYASAIGAFGRYLDRNPSASINERNGTCQRL